MTDQPEGQVAPSGGWFPPVKITNPWERGDPFIAFFNIHGAVVGLISADLAAFLWYVDTGTASQGALIGYVAGKAGTDPFGNHFNQGTSFTGSGMANPLTAPKQMIIGGTGGTPQALAGPTADGQFLGQESGVVGWYANGGGLVNPMNSKGAIIYSADGSGTPAELLMGAPGQFISNASGVPAWVSAASALVPLPFVIMTPTGDSSGTLDYNNFVAAQNSLSNGGVIYLAPGIYYTKNQWALKADTSQYTTIQVNKGNPVCLMASPAVTICGVGTFLTGVIYYHRDQGYGGQYNQPADPSAGFILGNPVIDGTFCTGNSVGLDVGDGRGYKIDVTCQNFDGAGQVGLQIINRVFWTEKGWFRAQLYNNATAAILTTAVPASDISNEFNQYDFILFSNQDQQGIVVDSVNQGKADIRIKGNMCQSSNLTGSGAPTNNVAALSIIKTLSASNQSRWYFGTIILGVEGNNTPQFPQPTPPTPPIYPYALYSDGTGYVQGCWGHIAHSLSDSVLNGAEFSCTGGFPGDPGLSGLNPTAAGGTSTSPPAFPGFGTIMQNTGPDQLACVSGGGTTGISVNGQATGLTSGCFFVKAGGSLTVNGTGSAPAVYTWIGAGKMSF